VPEEPFRVAEAAVPPKRLDAVLRAEGVAKLGRKVGVAALNDGRLVNEGDAVALGLDQPAVVAPAGPRSLEAVGLLLQAAWDLDVARLGDAVHLAAHPDRIAHVLERV